MGLGNDLRPIYLSIGNGKVVQRFSTPTAKSVQRITQTGKTVHEESHDHISGYLLRVEKTTSEDYGDFWALTLKDDTSEQIYQLQFNYDGAYATSFLKTIGNCDLSKPITFRPHLKMEGNIKKVSMFLIQNGKALKSKWNKESTNLPPPVKTRYKGEDKWDYYDQMQFLVKDLYEIVLPQLGIGIPNVPAKAAIALVENNAEDAINNPETEDLPF